MKKKITVMVEEGLLERVDELAKRERRSRNNLIVGALEGAILIDPRSRVAQVDRKAKGGDDD